MRRVDVLEAEWVDSLYAVKEGLTMISQSSGVSGSVATEVASGRSCTSPISTCGKVKNGVGRGGVYAQDRSVSDQGRAHTGGQFRWSRSPSRPS